MAVAAGGAANTYQVNTVALDITSVEKGGTLVYVDGDGVQFGSGRGRGSWPTATATATNASPEMSESLSAWAGLITIRPPV
jgi:hypothetical protein